MEGLWLGGAQNSSCLLRTSSGGGPRADGFCRWCAGRLLLPQKGCRATPAGLQPPRSRSLRTRELPPKNTCLGLFSGQTNTFILLLLLGGSSPANSKVRNYHKNSSAEHAHGAQTSSAEHWRAHTHMHSSPANERVGGGGSVAVTMSRRNVEKTLLRSVCPSVPSAPT